MFLPAPTVLCCPGDYILFKLSGERSTTCSGLSEQILWDFVADGRADFVADYYGIDPRSIPEALPSIGIQAHVSAGAAAELGLEPGIRSLTGPETSPTTLFH